MPFSPMFPGGTPVPDPRECPPTPASRRAGAISAVVTLVALVALGFPLLPRMAFIVPLLQAQVDTGGMGAASVAFQGFTYPWSRDQTGGGYTTPGSAQNMQSEADVFHMNAVMIPVIADMPVRSGSYIAWQSGQAHDISTLPDGDYEKAISDAKAAGLVPVLELEVRQHDPHFQTTTSSTVVGFPWFDFSSKANFSLEGASVNIGTTEATWFDNYTAFAVHFAQMSAKYQLPYYVIGDSLSSVSYDTKNTNKSGDPSSILNIPGEKIGTCTGRRDCEWRQVVYAVRNATYSSIVSHQVTQGGNYRGKLIYFANWDTVPNQLNSKPEFEGITWWQALDFIGVDAYFPLTASELEPTVPDLVAGWQGTNPLSKNTGQGDIVSRLQAVASNAGHPMVFTAGYESVTGDNQGPGSPPSTTPDENEQLNDMRSLLTVFSPLSWWSGVFWSADQPVAPRSAQKGWATSSNWAGDSLGKSKASGKFLAGYYQTHHLN